MRCMPSSDKFEAVILVRIDNMETYETVGQSSIRFPFDAWPSDASIETLIEEALDSAPPLSKWQTS